MKLKSTTDDLLPRFTLQPGIWYAMEFMESWSSDLYRMYSPVKIVSIHPKGSGKGLFDLQFFHANYPEGVQTKLYRLKTLQRPQAYLFAERLESSTPHMSVLLHNLTTEWLALHFSIEDREGVGAQAIMNRMYPSM